MCLCNMFGAGTTLENQMQQSASTLTVSKTSKETWPRRSLSRQMTWRSFERKVGNLEICVLGEIWQAGKKLEARKRSHWAKVRDQSWAQNLSCRTVSEYGEKVIFFFHSSKATCSAARILYGFH